MKKYIWRATDDERTADICKEGKLDFSSVPSPPINLPEDRRCVIVDDIDDPKNEMTPSQRAEVLQWYEGLNREKD